MVKWVRDASERNDIGYEILAVLCFSWCANKLMAGIHQGYDQFQGLKVRGSFEPNTGVQC